MLLCCCSWTCRAARAADSRMGSHVSLPRGPVAWPCVCTQCVICARHRAYEVPGSPAVGILPTVFLLRRDRMAAPARQGRTTAPIVRADRPSVCSPPAQHARPVLSVSSAGSRPPAAATPSVMELCSYSYLWFMCWRSICRDVYYWGGSGGLRSSSIFARDAAEAEAADPLVEDGWWWWLCNGADSSPNCATWD